MAINQSALDRFTFVHGSFGYAMERVGVGFGPTLVMAIAWELIEDDLKRAVPAMFPVATPDSRANAITDVLAAIAGWTLARNVSPRGNPTGEILALLAGYAIIKGSV